MKKLENYIERKQSILTEKENLEHLYTFRDFPVFMGCEESQDSSEDIVADMQWGICPETGIIQLEKLVPLEVLYQDQHNEGCGNTWHNHYELFCKFLKKQNPQSILEIGGAHGIIAKEFLKIAPKTKWTIVEPNPSFKGDENIKVRKAWFDETFAVTNSDVDTVVHSHVFEHTYNPKTFLENINNLLQKGGKQVFSIPNMLEQLKRKYTNCLNFEHTLFLTEDIIDHILARKGFKILEKEYFQDHSIFYATEKISNKEPGLLPSHYKEYKDLFNEFIDHHLGMVSKLNEKIERANDPVYLFGAHIFSQYLIGFGLSTDKIVNILDNGPAKQDKRLYGTNLTVKSPTILADKGRVAVILKAGAYNKEIKKDILENINSEVIFW